MTAWLLCSVAGCGSGGGEGAKRRSRISVDDEESGPSISPKAPVPESTKNMGCSRRRSEFKIDGPPDRGPQESLTIAARTGDPKKVQRALDNGADINFKGDRGMTPVMLAAASWSRHQGKQGSLGAVEALILKRANLEEKDNQGWTTIHHASRSGHEDVLRALIQHGAALRTCSKKSITTSSKKTPLILAAQDGNEEIVRALLAEGANIDRQDEDGWQPLMHACEKANKNLVSLLLKERADPNLAAADGMSPLMIACDVEEVDVVRLLAKRRADLNLSNCHGDTALMLCLKKRNVELAELLVQMDADLEPVNSDGERAIDIAYDANLPNVVSTMRKKMGMLHFEGKGK